MFLLAIWMIAITFLDFVNTTFRAPPPVSVLASFAVSGALPTGVFHALTAIVLVIIAISTKVFLCIVTYHYRSIITKFVETDFMVIIAAATDKS
jgi:hypothetical protein